MPKSSKQQRRKAPRKAPRKSTKRSAGILKSDVAQVTANLGQTTLGANLMYSFRNFSLSNSDRAKAVAQGYQYYRIKSVTLKVKPIYDTFQLGANSTVTLPYLYYMIDRHSVFPSNSTVNTLKSAGAKPHRLDDKTITIKFSPSVVNSSVVNQGTGGTPPSYGPGTYRTSPWLSTNANNNWQSATGPQSLWVADSTDHQGLVLFIEQYTVPTPNQVANLEYIIEYEFKKRFWEVGGATDTMMKIVDLDDLTIKDPEAPPETLKA